MKRNAIYTIGHGNKKPEDFLAQLKFFGFEYLVDVRSQPYSKFSPHFNQKDLKAFLEQNGIKYVFMGDGLGGRPRDASCYDYQGKLDYEIVKSKMFFRNDIERLKKAYSKDIRLVLMCSEVKPSRCHRTFLIGKILSAEDIIVRHIDEKGELKDQWVLMGERSGEISDSDLFGSRINTTLEEFM